MSITCDSIHKFKPMCDGFFTGFFSTLLFNPIDQALFLMLKEKKPLFDPSLWKNPYQGASKALYGRVIAYGVYFSLYDIYSDYFQNKTEHSLLAASLATGVSTVGLSHGFNVLKMYQSELAVDMSDKETLFKKIYYIIERLRIGPGTIRVGVGMAVADKIYHTLKDYSYPPFNKSMYNKND